MCFEVRRSYSSFAVLYSYSTDQGLSEYFRIMFDLFPHPQNALQSEMNPPGACMIMIGNEPIVGNGWDPEDQCMAKVALSTE